MDASVRLRWNIGARLCMGSLVQDADGSGLHRIFSRVLRASRCSLEVDGCKAPRRGANRRSEFKAGLDGSLATKSVL